VRPLYSYTGYHHLNDPLSRALEVVIAPPSLHLLLVRDLLSGTPKIEVAGQNAYHEPSGAFTGEVSVSQLQDAGIPWVILGHSERRTIFNEDNKEIAVKTKAALDHNLKVIVCVGETLAEREKNESVKIVVEQLSAVEDSVADWK
jgi:triosephosphate isomerase